MDPLEQIMLRMKDLQPQIPSWEKAEHMEISIPQKELWRYSKDPAKQRNKHKKTGMFDAVNRQVADVATQVGSTPASFSPGVFALVRNISKSVIIPIAGIPLISTRQRS